MKSWTGGGGEKGIIVGAVDINNTLSGNVRNSSCCYLYLTVCLYFRTERYM